VEVVGRRGGTLPAPPRIVFDALAEPHRPNTRAWLELRGSELEPTVVETNPPTRLVWTAPWPDRPEDRIEILIRAAPGGESHVEWVLWSVDGTPPDSRKRSFQRLQEMIQRDLRLSFGQ